MNKLLVWTSALIIFLAYSQATFAEDQNIKSCQQSACTCSHDLIYKLNLNPEQLKKIKTIRTQATLATEAHHKELVDIHYQIEALINADKLNDALLEVLLNQQKEVSRSVIKNRFYVKQQMNGILNTQQKAKYDELRKELDKNQTLDLQAKENSLAP